ncbi:uncharacterized protein LOC127832061 isoform X2 [Dreissena polymorpha]|uniref:uncharacterized protein LOC127832061 isoform X2 n=1 Tax=Dreissena polymorpha TaxID=45954 RepID=UPI00226476C7|nr:uncharacterized protein LOC127832061 isoform X2 [Dreissena polymorpha]
MVTAYKGIEKASLLIVLMHCTLLTLADTDLVGFQKVRQQLDSLGRIQNVVISDKGVFICRFGICYYSSFEALNRRFPGLFPTVEDYQIQTGLPSLLSNTCSYLKAQNTTSLGPTIETECSKLAIPGDGDDCCQTFKSIVPYTNYSSYRILYNLQGQQCYTLQLFTIGTCGDYPASNECANCLQDTHLMALYAYNYVTMSVGFNNFQIQSYCSCKALS